MAKICIDPGHGGSDSGGRGLGRKEKDDVLRMGLRLRDLLEAQGVNVVMTRTGDTNITIVNRASLANKAKCDYFLSIHRDAFNDATANGSNIYIYSKASAATESKAQIIYDAVIKASGFRRRGLKKGAANYTDFGVNKQTNMSAALLELGFITNIGDNALFDAAFDDIANAITKALCKVVGVSYKEPKLESAKPVSGAASSNAKVFYKPSVREWQLAAIADGYKFPKYGADGKWGAECEAVAKKANCYKRLIYSNRNLTKIVQRVVEVPIDGKFGAQTKAAVIAYQRANKLVADGVVGISTFKKMLKV